MKDEKRKNLVIDVEGSAPKISLKELSEDIGALLHFLRNHSTLADYPSKHGESDSDICSVWMLIPLQLDVVFRQGVNDCLLEKEVYSRKILIVSEPVKENQEQQRRRELLEYFSHVLDGDQANQIINLLQKLDEKSREQLSNDFQQYLKSREKNNKKSSQDDS